MLINITKNMLSCLFHYQLSVSNVKIISCISTCNLFLLLDEY